FTPRKATSIWSAVNLAKMQELIAAKRVSPHGLAVFEARDQTKTNKYSFEQKATAALERAQEQEFRANEAAWKHFSAQPPGYRHQLTWWVISAKKAETRARRLAQLIEASARGERLDRFVSKK
ncbi:MAG TPA: YdeI/OmpD-associated family protein, partial [Thermoanaerobaculia bacterium]